MLYFRGKETVALVKGSDKFYYSKALKVSPIDTTGAGDVFPAGFMYEIIKGWRIEDNLSFANKLAGISIKFIRRVFICKQIRFK